MQLELTANGLNPFDRKFTGLKFEEPEIPQGKLHETLFHMKHRYDEGIDQLTRLLMRDGKLSKAQTVSPPPPKHTHPSVCSPARPQMKADTSAPLRTWP